MALKERHQTTNHQFLLNISSDGWTNDQIQSAVLMDIRDELQKLNRHFQQVPRKLDQIVKNTAKKRKPKLK